MLDPMGRDENLGGHLKILPTTLLLVRKDREPLYDQ